MLRLAFASYLSLLYVKEVGGWKASKENVGHRFQFWINFSLNFVVVYTSKAERSGEGLLC